MLVLLEFVDSNEIGFSLYISTTLPFRILEMEDKNHKQNLFILLIAICLRWSEESYITTLTLVGWFQAAWV